MSETKPDARGRIQKKALAQKDDSTAPSSHDEPVCGVQFSFGTQPVMNSVGCALVITNFCQMILIHLCQTKIYEVSLETCKKKTHAVERKSVNYRYYENETNLNRWNDFDMFILAGR